MDPYLQGTDGRFFEVFEKPFRAAWEAHSFDKPLAFFTICSHAKPYSKSFIHTSIRQGLYNAGLLQSVDYIHISNAGLVPTEVEMDYPFCAYDWNVHEAAPEDIQTHIRVTTARLKWWAENFKDRYRAGTLAYLRYGGHTHQAAQGSGIFDQILALQTTPSLPFVAFPDVDDCLTIQHNLDRLVTKIEGALK